MSSVFWIDIPGTFLQGKPRQVANAKVIFKDKLAARKALSSGRHTAGLTCPPEMPALVQTAIASPVI